MREVLGIDIGGSGIKGAIVDIDSGDLASERHRIPTPRPATPRKVSAAVQELVAEFDYSGRIGCCFPTIVIDGRAQSRSNLHEAWVDTAIDESFSAATGLPFTVLNDADAAGIAEMRLGAGIGLDGKVITITIGTGLGSGLFYRGQLIPNLELGHMPGKDGKPIEHYASNRARKENDLSWEEWGSRFDYFLNKAARVCTPDHFILGGGASKKFDKFRRSITEPTPIHIAQLRNNAGIVGAAVAAGDME
jgi:polyphosphate glucokinase